MGEIFVFVFFGVVATAGTTFVVIEAVTALSLVSSVAVGFLACALLVVNNLRDIPTDSQVARRRSPCASVTHGRGGSTSV